MTENLLLKIFVCFLAGAGAGLGTGFAGMSAAGIISPLLLTFCGIPPYQAIGIGLISDVLASAVSAWIYKKHGNLDIKNASVLLLCVLGMTIFGSYVASLLPARTMGSMSQIGLFAVGLKFLLKPGRKVKEASNESRMRKTVKSIIGGMLVGFICGFVGAGGGMMLLFVLTAFLGYEMHMAVGTSVFIMAFTALIGGASHIYMGGIPDMLCLGLCVVFTFVWARIAAAIANKASEILLSRVAGTIMVVSSVIVMGFNLFAKSDFTKEITIEISGLEKEYNYAIVNDIHLFVADDEIREEYEELVHSRIDYFSLNGKTSAQNLREWARGLSPKKVDGLVLNADILDQLSYANLQCLDEILEEVKVPFMYLQSDHDCATDWTDLSLEDCEKIDEIRQRRDFGKAYYTFETDEIIILGISYSWMSVSEDTLLRLREEFAKGKPIILVTHVPYDSVVSSELRDLSARTHNNQILLWNKDGDSACVPTPAMRELLNMVYDEHSPVVAVISAHLHEEAEVKLTDSITEYVLNTGYSGNRALLHLVPAK